jgi:hypothetical protein
MQIRQLMGLLVMALILLAGCAAAEVQGATAALSPDAGIASNQALERRLHLAALFDAAILDQTVYHKYDQIIVRWPQDMALSGEITLRIQKPDGRIYGERHAHIEAGSVINLGEAYILRDGDYHIVLMPPVTEYYMGGMRIDRKLDIEVRVWQPS